MDSVKIRDSGLSGSKDLIKPEQTDLLLPPINEEVAFSVIIRCCFTAMRICLRIQFCKHNTFSLLIKWYSTYVQSVHITNILDTL
jgi:hypothetical protein